MTKTVEERWRLSQRPRKFKVSNRKATYAVVMVLGADSDLAVQVQPDLREMVAGVGDNVSALLLIDIPGRDGAAVIEITPEGTRPLAQLDEISTGDPRPIADFFARALVSYSAKTRFALGFWGHGKGAFADDDPSELLLPAALMRLPLPPRPRRSRRSGGASAQSMLPDADAQNSLTNREARSALGAAFARADRTKPVDMIFSDTCLNGSVEVFAELREFTQTVVASSLLIPAGGWNYKFWLGATGRKMPATARAWAEIAVEEYESAHPQLGELPPAQLAAFSTEVDLVKAFAKVVKDLSALKQERRLLLGAAANRVQSVQYRENLDLEQLVRQLQRVAPEESKLRGACRDFLDVFDRSLVAISSPPKNGEDLSGLTIWCPIRGDVKQVSRYYPKLEFAKKTKWLKLLKDIERDRQALPQ